MTRSNRPRQTIVMSTLLLAVCAGGLGLAPATTAAAVDPMNMVPDNSLFCVRINNLDGALGQVDLFLTGISPMGVGMLAKAQLGKMLGSVQPNGVNMSGSFTVFGPLPGGDFPDPTRVGILVPISNYQQFTADNPNVSPPDAMGVSKISSEGDDKLAAVHVGEYALLSTPANAEALVEMGKSAAGATAGLAASLDAAELKRAQSAPLWVYGNVELAAQMFGPLIQAKIQEFKQDLGQDEDEGAGLVGQIGQIGQVVDLYAGLLDSMMKETKFISLTLAPSTEKIGAAFVLAAKPDTGMAELFKAKSTQSDNRLLGYLEDGAIMNFSFSSDPGSWKTFMDAYANLLGTFLGADSSAQETDALKKLMADIGDALGGTAAFSFSADLANKPPFTVKYVATLKDSQKLYQVLDETSKMVDSGPIAELYKKLGLKLKFDLRRKAETYKGVPIDSFDFAIDALDENAQEAQMITAIYGGGMNGQLAVVDNLLVYAIAKEPGPAIRALVDKVKAGGAGPASGEVQSAMQLIPGAEKADFFATYNYLRLMQMITAIMPMPIPKTSVPSESNIAIAGSTANGKATYELAVPKKHVLEIMMVIMQMQQQKTQQSSS